jgi:hypothetical protein
LSYRPYRTILTRSIYCDDQDAITFYVQQA